MSKSDDLMRPLDQGVLPGLASGQDRPAQTLEGRGKPESESTAAKPTDDEALFARLKTDDQAALATLFNRHHAGLRGFAASIAGHDTADEVVQEVFVEIWKRRFRLGENVSARAYLYRAVRNRALNARRSYRRRWRRLIGLDAASHVSVPPPATDASDLARAVRKAVERLPERQRTAFRLRREIGLTYAEIATAMGISRNTVENHIVRATRAIREAIPPELLGR